MRAVDLIVIGAGPAGMAAATAAAGAGLAVVVPEEQPGPGGQIHRAVTGAGSDGLIEVGGVTRQACMMRVSEGLVLARPAGRVGA